jgi:hypothetical protein
MKSKIFLAGIFALTVFCQSAFGQPASPTPDKRKPQPTGTVTGGVDQIINSKLLIYTKNGLGTTSTNTGGEFPSQLVASATANKEFGLQWSRTKAGKAEKANLYIAPINSTAWVGVQSLTMPAQSTAVDIQYSMANLAPNTYLLKVVGETGSSTKVRVNYTGKDSNGTSVVVTPTPTGGTPVQTSKVKVIGAKFTPRVGTINQPGYQDARLSLTLEAGVDTQIKEIAVEVYSEPFIKSELVTASGSKNAPIKLFSGRSTALTLHPEIRKVITIILYRTSKDELNAQEAGPGIYSPGDWNFAYGQTTTASFRCNVDGKLSSSFEQSPQKQWQWGLP